MEINTHSPNNAKRVSDFKNSGEERMAVLLDIYGVRYKYEEPFPVKNGIKHRTVDFVLKKPIKVRLAKRPVQYIEVKDIETRSAMSDGAQAQRDELRNAGIVTFIVTRRELTEYEQNGLFEKRTPGGSKATE